MADFDRLFLDTEWADAAGQQLVSLAVVSEDGVHRFYAERAELPATATQFVREVVYPLLDRGRWAMSDQAMTTGLRAFLGAFAEPYVLADYPNDFQLLQRALHGFELAEDLKQACGPIPKLVLTPMFKDGMLNMLIEDWFEAHPDQRARRHHALVDAQALRMAWLAATGRISPPWATTIR